MPHLSLADVAFFDHRCRPKDVKLRYLWVVDISLFVYNVGIQWVTKCEKTGVFSSNG